MTCCIVVPLYKEFNSLTADEIISLNQLYKILGTHSIYFIVPDSLNIKDYLHHAKEHNTEVNLKRFSDFYFSGINGYNQLLLSKKLYQAFTSYQYMLIYQTDAFVFRDELNYWCNMKYDYIGAPWFEGWVNPSPKASIIGVGNGGFSLRNINSAKKYLKKYNFVKRVWQFYSSSLIKRIITLGQLYKILSFKTRVNYNQGIFTFLFDGNYALNEDAIWGHYMPLLFTNFKVAPVNDAIQFSFETNPDVLYKMNNNKLPFGCHAWGKWNAEFWSTHISGG